MLYKFHHNKNVFQHTYFKLVLPHRIVESILKVLLITRGGGEPLNSLNSLNRYQLFLLKGCSTFLTIFCEEKKCCRMYQSEFYFTFNTLECSLGCRKYYSDVILCLSKLMFIKYLSTKTQFILKTFKFNLKILFYL